MGKFRTYFHLTSAGPQSCCGLFGKLMNDESLFLKKTLCCHTPAFYLKRICMILSSFSAGLPMLSLTTDWCCSPQSCFRREARVGVSQTLTESLTHQDCYIFPKSITDSSVSAGCDASCLVYLPLVSKGNKEELRCSLECKYLNSDDYKDLLWTTLSEFPGTRRSFLKRLKYFKLNTVVIVTEVSMKF